MVVLAVLHMPPVIASLNCDTSPLHNVVVPLIAPAVGKGLTVTFVFREQPVGNIYVIVEEPEETPLTTPVPDTTVATELVELLHVPLPVASLKVVVEPTQTVVLPVILAGKGLTVKDVLVKQPVDNL